MGLVISVDPKSNLEDRVILILLQNSLDQIFMKDSEDLSSLQVTFI